MENNIITTNQDSQLQINQQYNQYPNIIEYDNKNPCVRSPYASFDLSFYQTKESFQDIDTFRNFLKNAETRFRASKEYKAYKAYLIDYLGIDRCQVMGNITTEDASIELHHNVLGLFDICLLIASHVVNTVGIISTFDLIQLLIQEHKANRVGVTFLCKTAHQLYTNDPNAYIPPEMTFGKWWELLSIYRYGITYDIAYKIINYLKRYQTENNLSIHMPLQDEVLSFAAYNEYGWPSQDCGYINGEPLDNRNNYMIGDNSLWN